MSKTIYDLIDLLGPEVLPFERDGDPNKKPTDEETIDFSQYSYNAIRDGSPEPVDMHMSMEDSNKHPKPKMFIWLIYLLDEELQFKMIPDSYENTIGKQAGGRPNVCHSNLSKGGKALQGGECWWCEENRTMYVNPKSGRYGAKTTVQWEAVLDFFRLVGYENVVDIKAKEWALR